VAVTLFVVHARSGATTFASVASSAANSDTNLVANPLDSCLLRYRRQHFPRHKLARDNSGDQPGRFGTRRAGYHQNSDSLITKPQIVASAFKSNKDIKLYIAQGGDTVASVAANFGITSDSVRWSNDLAGSTVTAGQKLYIPP